MAWVRTDDGAPDHPKFVGLGDAEVALWWRALCYCNRYRTDGIVPPGAIAKLCRAKRPDAVAAELARVGLWERLEDGSWRFHDYLQYQKSRAQIEKDAGALSEARRSAGRKGGVRSGESRKAKRGGRQDEANHEANHEANEEAASEQTGKQNEAPSPSPSPSPSPAAAARNARPLASLAPDEPGAETLDLIAFAHELAEKGSPFGRSVVDRAAGGQLPTPKQREKLREMHAEQTAAVAAAAAAKANTHPPAPAPFETPDPPTPRATPEQSAATARLHLDRFNRRATEPGGQPA